MYDYYKRCTYLLKSHQNITGKADKVSSATNGHIASLDANGNLVDSGIAKTDIPLLSAVQNALFPVGSVYITYTNTNPATLLGFGTWSALTTGYLKTGGSNATGGSGESGSTTLTVDQIPSHNHTMAHTHTMNHDHSFNLASSNWGGSSAANYYIDSSQKNAASYNNVDSPSFNDYQGSTGASSAANTGSKGGGQGHTHTIEPTYTRIYAWRRTA